MSANSARSLAFDVRAISAAQGGAVNATLVGDIVTDWLNTCSNYEVFAEQRAHMQRRIELYKQFGYPVPPYWMTDLEQYNGLVTLWESRIAERLADLAARGVPAVPLAA